MEVSERLDVVEKTLSDLLEKLSCASEKVKNDEAFNDFKSKYAERLEPYKEKIAIICGPDYDAVSDLFNTIKAAPDYGSEGFDMDSLVNDNISGLQEKFKALTGLDHQQQDDEPKVAVDEQKADDDLLVPSLEQLTKEYKQYQNK